MSRRCTRSRLWLADAGNAAVSFAIVLPVFLLITLSLFEYGIFIFVGANLEAAVRDASRFGATGAEVTGMSRQDRILDIVEERTLGMLKPENAQVTTRVFPSFASIGNEDGTPGAGGPGDVVFYQVRYTWTAVTPLLDPLLTGQTLSASVALQNEEF